MSAARVLGVLLPLVLVIAAAGIPWMLRQERRRSSSYPGSAAHREALARAGVTSMAGWRARSAEEQEAADDAALDLAEQGDLDAKADADEAAAHLVQRVQANALFHP